MKEEESSTMQVERTNTNDQPMEKQLTLHPSRDVATQLVDGVVAGNITPEEERKCLRRIDLILLPVMFMSFAFQYMDKACLTGAALFGIITDLHLASSYVFDSKSSSHQPLNWSANITPERRTVGNIRSTFKTIRTAP
jgi:hypothetical protein